MCIADCLGRGYLPSKLLNQENKSIYSFANTLDEEQRIVTETVLLII